ncbi:hypothetical protein NE237_019401 [Protea cynaroides]|uniref:Uncharacterized protein n=1 Tax=Protea cynaroides TaxID=273540 RepID=A0A9Q0KBR5_9MAGN|nr:hypothetical protein NE237_019401 [Protea cynaroides]
MSQEQGEVWNRAYCERDALRAGLDEMRPFGEAKSISGHQTWQLMRRPIGVKGSVYVVTLTAFQRCLKDKPEAGDSIQHLEANHGLQATPASLEKETLLGVIGSIVPVAFRTSYSSFLKVGGRDLFSATEKSL